MMANHWVIARKTHACLYTSEKGDSFRDSCCPRPDKTVEDPALQKPLDIHSYARGHGCNLTESHTLGSNSNAPAVTISGKAARITSQKGSWRALPFTMTFIPVRCERRNKA